MTFRFPGDTAGVNVLSIRPFRRLWIATSLSSLGDWLSLLALTAEAAILAKRGIAAQGAAVSGVWLTSLLPALLLGPLAGAVADRFDRRMNMIIGDVFRGVLYASIPVNLAFGFVNKLTWIYVVQFLASCASLFWTPAKDASIPNLVPPDKLEQANQYSLFTTFGTAPVAGVVFGLLALVGRVLGSPRPGEPRPVLQRGDVRGVRADHLRAQGDSQAPGERAHLGAVGGQGHLGGLEVHRPDRRGARDRDRDGRRLRGRWGGGGPGPLLHQEHPERWQRGLGGRLHRDLHRAGRAACSSACASCAGSAGAACSA